HRRSARAGATGPSRIVVAPAIGSAHLFGSGVETEPPEFCLSARRPARCGLRPPGAARGGRPGRSASHPTADVSGRRRRGRLSCGARRAATAMTTTAAPPAAWTRRHLLGLEELSAGEITRILDLAETFVG